MALREIVIHLERIGRSTLWLQVVLILPVDGAANSNLLVADRIIFTNIAYSCEPLETCILYYVNIANCDWILSAKTEPLVVKT
jgi:hypothetical protein